MSNFVFRARHKATGNVYKVYAMDDYFGKHLYGYQVMGRVYNDEEFDRAFERIKSK